VSELLTQKATSVAIAAPKDAEGTSGAAAIAAQLAKSHIPTKTVTYDPSSNSFGSVATEVLASKPKAVVELGGADGAALTSALIKAGAVPASLVAGPNMLTPALAQAVDPAKVSAVNGMYVAGPGGDANFDSRVGQTTSNSLLDAAQSYDCAVIIALGAEEAKSTDPSAFASHIADVTTGSHRCTTYALCLALLRQGKSIAYVGHAGPLRLNAQNQPTSAREILGYFNNGYLGQADFYDSPISGSS
jgi:branched-chain amino acid transport system substrate-binding protein